MIKCWKYSQPQSGGQFALTLPYLEKYYSAIEKMTKAKYNSALFSQAVGKLYNVTIQPEAVSNAMMSLHLARNI